MNPYPVWLISWSVLIEAIRRKEIYAIVLVSSLLIGAVMTVDFFEIEGLTKFYREIALKVMSVSTALTVIILSARQLPREFENRTIYPLLAKPISRPTFLVGKLLGVLFAAAFCFALFMLVYIGGTYYLGGTIPWGLFLQYIYLQLLMMSILVTLSFWLSMLLNLDAAITVGVLLYALAAIMMNMTTFLYDYVPGPGQWVIKVMTFAIPQLPLFDLSEKAVHADFTAGTQHVAVWSPLDIGTMGALTAYGLFFTALYFAFALLCFRRKPL